MNETNHQLGHHKKIYIIVVLYPKKLSIPSKLSKEYMQFEINFPHSLGSLPSNATSQLNILGHDGHSFGMDGAEIGVLEKTNEI